jgi:hypothetical protein
MKRMDYILALSDKNLFFYGKSIRNERYTVKEKIGAKGEGQRRPSEESGTVQSRTLRIDCRL